MAPQRKKEAKYEKLLKKIYYTPKEATSFSGTQRLKHALHTKGTKGTKGAKKIKAEKIHHQDYS